MRMYHAACCVKFLHAVSAIPHPGPVRSISGSHKEDYYFLAARVAGLAEYGCRSEYLCFIMPSWMMTHAVQFLTTFVISLMKAIDIRSESAVKLLAEFLDMDDGYVDGGRHVNAEHFAHG